MRLPRPRDLANPDHGAPPRASDSAGPGRGLRMGPFHTFPGDADADADAVGRHFENRWSGIKEN